MCEDPCILYGGPVAQNDMSISWTEVAKSQRADLGSSPKDPLLQAKLMHSGSE